jgi:hypothetical protein
VSFAVPMAEVISVLGTFAVFSLVLFWIWLTRRRKGDAITSESTSALLQELQGPPASVEEGLLMRRAIRGAEATQWAEEDPVVATDPDYACFVEDVLRTRGERGKDSERVSPRFESGFRDLERFFRDARGESYVLEPGVTGVACRNLRTALRLVLRYDKDPRHFSDTYDGHLAELVARFQKEYEHTSRDGLVGPGTRRLLVEVLSKEAAGGFYRLTDPEGRFRGFVFVSYARKDAHIMREYILQIRSLGFKVWYDDDIAGSEKWRDTLEQRVRDCYMFIVFLSEAAVQSKWVKREVKLANKCGKTILPVRIGPLPARHPFKRILEERQTLDATTADILARLGRSISVAHRRAYQY